MTETSPTPPRRRAPAMDPDQRRKMIVAAALPLVVEYGAAVTTAKIARAAGIGEGTIFRVFPDKDTLIAACVAEATRPDEAVAHLEAIDLDQPLDARLAEAAEVMRGHMTRIGAVVGALVATGKLERRAPDASAEGGGLLDREAGLAAPRAALTALFEPDRERLRLAPERLADSFQLLLMFAGRPGANDPLTADELVDLFLHGALAGPGQGG